MKKEGSGTNPKPFKNVWPATQLDQRALRNLTPPLLPPNDIALNTTFTHLSLIRTTQSEVAIKTISLLFPILPSPNCRSIYCNLPRKVSFFSQQIPLFSLLGMNELSTEEPFLGSPADILLFFFKFGNEFYHLLGMATD